MLKEFNLSSHYQNRLKSPNFLFQLLSMLTTFSMISSCGVKYTPSETFQEQDSRRHQKSEVFLKSKYPNKKYESLAFGKTIVYKPPSFDTLDSLYAVKKEYIDNNELRELKLSGVEDMIENYRPTAQKDIDKVRYEFEHIYYLTNDDTVNVKHDFLVLDHKDSITTHTPFYSYKISKSRKELHNSYLFEFHFVTDRDLYISGREREFIQHFKAKEEALIGEPQLQPFMTHTLDIMKLANHINSVDFNLLTKQLSLNIVNFLSKDAVLESFGTLIALEDEYNNVLGYERSVTWSENNKVNETKIIFNPYLQLEKMETKTKDKLK